ncbi:MAG: hypothetical protein WC647_19165 [Desulfomonilaceae bacterium]|jgi:hypothetical protein
MEQEQFFYNLFMAQQEQRRAEKKAAKAKQIRDGHYDHSNGLWQGLWIIGGMIVFIGLVLSWR